MVTKAHILQEIKRMAEANNGKPVGSQRFESETGIRPSDWKGKHWARWSEALNEAGYVPNQLVTAYDVAELLGKYARLAQELGRLPASADLRLKAHNDPEFPSNSTFEKIGSKSDFVKQLREYCLARSEFNDVIELCNEYEPRKHNDCDANLDQEEIIGFVYLMKSGRFYKIGKSNAAGRREYELAIQLPEKLKTIHVIRTDDPSGIEEYWHKRFASKRKNGEWFALDAADVKAFKRRKFV